MLTDIILIESLIGRQRQVVSNNVTLQENTTNHQYCIQVSEEFVFLYNGVHLDESWQQTYLL